MPSSLPSTQSSDTLKISTATSESCLLMSAQHSITPYYHHIFTIPSPEQRSLSWSLSYVWGAGASSVSSTLSLFLLLWCVHTKCQANFLCGAITYKVKAKTQICAGQRVMLCCKSLSVLTFSWHHWCHWHPDVESEKEEKIIVAVCVHPDLYHTSWSIS